MILPGPSYVENRHQLRVVPEIIRSLIGGEGKSLRESHGRYRESMGSLSSELTGGQVPGRLGGGVAEEHRLVSMVGWLSVWRQSTGYSVLSVRKDAPRKARFADPLEELT